MREQGAAGSFAPPRGAAQDDNFNHHRGQERRCAHEYLRIQGEGKTGGIKGTVNPGYCKQADDQDTDDSGKGLFYPGVPAISCFAAQIVRRRLFIGRKLPGLLIRVRGSRVRARSGRIVP